jgi:hypothetical protein
MKSVRLTRALVKTHIEDADKIFVAEGHNYVPETEDHRRTWPKIVEAIGQRGAWYSTLKALSGSNKDYVAYLIGDLGALRCPALERRLISLR